MGTGRASVGWFSTVGLAFWFFVGFPFGNHNESYYWVARFEHERLWAIVWTKTLAATARPLGQGLAYVGWQLPGQSSSAVQIFNFVLAAVALFVIALAIPQGRTFAVAMVVAGAGFFAGYIYLFHLHGIFYSPVLALVAVLLHLHEAEGLSPLSREVAGFACALAVGLLFHPYALILFGAYLGGLAVERWRESSSTDQLRRALLCVLGAGALAAERPHGHQVLSGDNIRAFLASYALTEVSPVLAVVSAVFAAATLFSTATMSRVHKSRLTVAVLLLAVAFLVMGLPVVLLWIAAAVFKTAYLGKWSLACMTAGAALLPCIALSGSPTYAIFAILMSTIALAWGWVRMERILERLGCRWAIVAVVLGGLLVGALRLGVEVPIASRLSQPLLAEREKTRQLETVIDWMLESEYRSWHLALEDNANPVDAGRSAVDRARRPPTYQDYLDAYMASRRSTGSVRQTLVVAFGSHGRGDMTLVKAVPGSFAGTAMVFK